MTDKTTLQEEKFDWAICNEMMAQIRLQMDNAWRDLSGYFAPVAGRYEQQLAQWPIIRLPENLVANTALLETAVSPFIPLTNELPDV